MSLTNPRPAFRFRDPGRQRLDQTFGLHPHQLNEFQVRRFRPLNRLSRCAFQRNVRPCRHTQVTATTPRRRSQRTYRPQRETLLGICVPERAPRIPIQLITLRGKRGYGLASALQVPDGTCAALSLLPERPNDRPCDHSQQPLGPSDNAGTNSDSPGVLVAAEPLLGPGDQGCPRPDRGRAPSGARTTTAQISSPRTSSANPMTRPGRCPDGLPVSLQPRADNSRPIRAWVL